MLEAVFPGAFWAGFNVAAFTIPIANSPKSHRTSYLAMFSVVTGLGFFTASMLGGWLAVNLSSFIWHWGSLTLINYQILFLISCLIRVIVATLILTFHEPNEKPVPVMINFIGYAVLKRLSGGRQIFPFGVKLEENEPMFDERRDMRNSQMLKMDDSYVEKKRYQILP